METQALTGQGKGAVEERQRVAARDMVRPAGALQQLFQRGEFGIGNHPCVI